MDTLDISGLPQEKVDELQRIVKLWREETQAVTNGENGHEINEDIISKAVDIRYVQKRKVDPSEFITKKSHVLGGKVTRAMAYEDE